MSEYNFKDLINSLKKVGLKKNDNIFIHSNIGLFGNMKGMNNKEKLVKSFYFAIKKILGNKGTITVPSFSYSFFKKEIFYKNKSKSDMGIFAEYVRLRRDSIRSDDPNFSVSSIGFLSKFLTSDNINLETYSKNSFFEKFHSLNGKIMNFNFPGSTFIHYYEKKLGVKYRYEKSFSGINEGKKEKWKVFSKYLSKKETFHNPFPVTNLIKKRKIAKVSQLGKGEIVCITSNQLYRIIKSEIKKNRWLLTMNNKVKY